MKTGCWSRALIQQSLLLSVPLKTKLLLSVVWPGSSSKPNHLNLCWYLQDGDCPCKELRVAHFQVHHVIVQDLAFQYVGPSTDCVQNPLGAELPLKPLHKGITVSAPRLGGSKRVGNCSAAWSAPPRNSKEILQENQVPKYPASYPAVPSLPPPLSSMAHLDEIAFILQK